MWSGAVQDRLPVEYITRNSNWPPADHRAGLQATGNTPLSQTSHDVIGDFTLIPMIQFMFIWCNSLQISCFCFVFTMITIQYFYTWNDIYEGILIFTSSCWRLKGLKPDVKEWCRDHSRWSLLSYLYNKAYGEWQLHWLGPCWNNPTPPRSSWYRGLILIYFLVPSSSSVFTNVSIDHWLHLVEWVFAAWMIQLGVYHRALEHRKDKEWERQAVRESSRGIRETFLKQRTKCSTLRLNS